MWADVMDTFCQYFAYLDIQLLCRAQASQGIIQILSCCELAMRLSLLKFCTPANRHRIKINFRMASFCWILPWPHGIAYAWNFKFSFRHVCPGDLQDPSNGKGTFMPISRWPSFLILYNAHFIASTTSVLIVHPHNPRWPELPQCSPLASHHI